MSVEKLDSPVFRSIMNKELHYLFDLFKKNSYEIRIAGGAVRDLLMNIRPHDIDFATTATPDQMKEMFQREQIRMINTNGEKHGTITVRLDDKENYEITTLRIDVTTDGRRAEVQFTNDWRLDANRRDLTVNSIFLDSDGTIVDFFNGYEDLKSHRIRFVGDPNVRIQEDFLRILRYFRFYSRVCLNENSHDQSALSAIKANSAGLRGIAGERIWVEFKKIVQSRFADSLMKLMIETDVLQNIGFPASLNLADFTRVYQQFEHDLTKLPTAITMVCILLNSEDDFELVNKRIKFSNEEKRAAEFFFAHRQLRLKLDSFTREQKLKHFKFIIVDNSKDAKIYEKLADLLKYLNQVDLIQELTEWQVPVFPINGNQIASKNIPKGPMFTHVLKELRELWKNEFNMDTSKETVDKLLLECDRLIA